MHKFIRNLNEAIANTALRKHQAAQARSGRGDCSTESTKEVYQRACEVIYKDFASDDFSFAKSGPKFTKKGADFSYQVSFQSSRNNVSGQHIALWIHATIRSKRLEAWRKSQTKSLRTDAWVAGGQIGNLLPRHGWLEWELAKENERGEVIADAVRAIRKGALQYFFLFADIVGKHFNKAGRDYVACEIHANRNPKQYGVSDDSYDTQMVFWLIDFLLLGRDTEMPSAPRQN
jgi:hypothetical protein